ncbi:hypothetical protein SS1G_05308 [Sclerotinia sclerotiorum 1980 UF-70]|uniref:Stress-response A/B barrel domain-containing protein n=2 Tax=Sclerotinia sclerotiorum (strain ATCC 18683 / 1980 / Ss-1) TaxID=665079 RepID=A7EJ15_SCLS1|nr:hypothetical protein SS1G_05308 [Sclerotinia sclerotiorum 1980 UF-70]APA11807.1 hypothetical protein sscle_08g065770 [Sclerotinia sclerotiorum 1980 UF-70]EDO02831.1 hypothetical protein SS1G_05308 [Sclerotinia sclerotiorum 1980 UF-70]
MAGIIRITMFKAPTQSSRDALLKNYEKLSKTAVKNSTPYILSLQAGESQPNDPRTQGYSVVAKTEFKDLEDMKYYEDSCEAHRWFKGEVKNLGVEGVCCVFFEASVVG